MVRKSLASLQISAIALILCGVFGIIKGVDIIEEVELLEDLPLEVYCVGRKRERHIMFCAVSFFNCR